MNTLRDNVSGGCGCLTLMLFVLAAFGFEHTEEHSTTQWDIVIFFGVAGFIAAATWGWLFGDGGLWRPADRPRKADSKARLKADLDKLWRKSGIAQEPDEPHATSGYVYILHHTGGYYKIGRTTKDPTRRISQLQTGTPHKLHLERLIKTHDPAGLEADLHAMLAHKRYQGEWFALTEQELRILNRIADDEED